MNSCSGSNVTQMWFTWQEYTFFWSMCLKHWFSSETEAICKAELNIWILSHLCLVLRYILWFLFEEKLVFVDAYIWEYKILFSWVKVCSVPSKTSVLWIVGRKGCLCWSLRSKWKVYWYISDISYRILFMVTHSNCNLSQLICTAPLILNCLQILAMVVCNLNFLIIVGPGADVALRNIPNYCWVNLCCCLQIMISLSVFKCW